MSDMLYNQEWWNLDTKKMLSFKNNLGYPDWLDFDCQGVKGKTLSVWQNDIPCTPLQETQAVVLSQKDVMHDGKISFVTYSEFFQRKHKRHQMDTDELIKYIKIFLTTFLAKLVQVQY